MKDIKSYDKNMSGTKNTPDQDEVTDIEQRRKIIKTFKKKFFIYRFGFYIFLIITFVLGGLAVYAVYTNPLINIKIPFISPDKSEVEIENEKMMAYIKTLISIPDEKPIITEVLTKEMIESQPFFENAEIGDKLIIFYQSKRAMLYSPKDKKIKELANVKTADPDLPREMIGI